MSDNRSEKAVVQSFIDVIVGALATKGSNGEGYGWHLVSLGKTDDGIAVIRFENNLPLRHYENGTEFTGPHSVLVEVRALGSTSVASCWLCGNPWTAHPDRCPQRRAES